MLARLVRCAIVIFALAATVPLGTAESDSGTIHTGVGSEREASSFPCTGDSGPVVCVTDRGGDWELESEASGECSEGVAGWQGDCVFAFDAGDLLRVWGTRGISPRAFQIVWLPDEPTPDAASQPRRSDRSGHGQQAAPAPSPTPAVPVVARRGSDRAVAAAPAQVEPEASESPSPPAREPTVPDDAIWDPPISEVPGYSDLAAAPQPTFPASADHLTQEDAGAPAAAGLVALLAAGWAVRLHRRDPEESHASS